MNYRRREAMRFETVIMNHHNTALLRIGFLSNNDNPSLASRDFAHVLALELLRVSM